MDVASFVDVDPDSPDSLAQFVDRNALFHQSVANALLSTGIVAERYPLWGEVDDDWVALNYRECFSWGAQLAIEVPAGLDTLKTDDRKIFFDWLNNLSLFYQRVAQNLSI